MVSNLLDGLWRLTIFVANNPAKVFLLVLSGQMLEASALNTFPGLSTTSHSNVLHGLSVYVPHSIKSSGFSEHLVVPAETKSYTTKDVVKKSRIVRESSIGPQKLDTKQKIDELKRKLHDIENKVHNLVTKRNEGTKDIETLTQLLAMKEEIAASIASVTTRVDDIKTHVSQEFLKDIDALNTQIQNLRATNDQVTIGVRVINDVLKNITIEDCIAAIKEERFDTAKAKWTRVQSYNNVDADIPRIVQGAFDNSINNFEKVNHFISNTLPLWHKAVGYTTLMEELKRNGQFFTSEMIQIGYGVKKHTEMTNYINADQKYKNLFESLKSGLPEDVRNILWGAVCVKNLMYAEYLHPLDGTGGNPVTWSVLNWECFKKNAWVFEAVQLEKYDQGKFFRIQNKETKQYVCGLSANHDSLRGKGLMQTTLDDDCYWKIEPDNDSSYKIKSKKHNAYLFAHNMHDGAGSTITTKRGQERSRFAFIYKSTGVPLDAHWSFDDCREKTEKKVCFDGYN